MLTIKPKTRKEIYLAYLSGDMSLELPEPLTRDEVNLYNLCKNKAYGEYTTVKDVLAECHQPSNDAITINEPINLVVGREYIVTFRGVEYRCVAQEIVSDGISFAMLGNGTEMGGTGNGEPFTIVEYPAEIAASTGFVVYILGDGTADYTISIRQEVTEVQKISGKYVEGMGWREKGEVIVIPEQTIAAVIGSPVSVDSKYAVSAGDPVTVVWDGVSFECVADEIDSYVCVGNAALGDLGEDTDEPFLIIFMGYTALVFAKTAKDVSVSVTAVGDIIHPIESEYIDGTTTKIFYGTADEKGNGIVTLFNPIAEIAKAAKTNNVVLRLYQLEDGFYESTSFISYYLAGSSYYDDANCHVMFVHTLPTDSINEDRDKGLRTRVVHAHGTLGVEHYIYSFTADECVTKGNDPS